MRKWISFAVMILGLATTFAQEPAMPVPDRFGIAFKDKPYSQATPKAALASVIEAITRGRGDYLVAHLMDPTFVDAKVADRACLLEGAAEADLIRLRDAQRTSTVGIPDRERVPDDPIGFKMMLARTASARAVQQVMADVSKRVVEDPETLKELRRFLREGVIMDADPISKVTLPDVKERAVFFKKIGDRWFMENRQMEEKAPAPAAAP